MKSFTTKASVPALAVALTFGLAGLVLAATVVNLGTADSFAVLAGSAVTNTGFSVINGDLGVSPGTAVTGFPPGTVNGTQHVADAVAAQAQSDLTAAYNSAAGQPASATVPTELGGTTKTPGVYDSKAGTFGITGQLTLDALGDPNAVFIFKTASTLITASSSTVVLVNGAQACRVFWQVGSSATLGTNSDFKGNILALTSITLTTGADVEGRVLARNGSVTLDTNTVTRATCAAAATPTPTGPAGTATPTPTGPPGTATPTPTGPITQPTNTPPRTPTGMPTPLPTPADIVCPIAPTRPHIYGGSSSNHILIPFFDVDLDILEMEHRNVIIVVANLTTDTPNNFPVTGSPVAADFHLRIFNQDSQEACDVCLPQTARDVLSANVAQIISESCSDAGRALLLDPGTGRFRGYVLVELNRAGSNCTANTDERCDGFGIVGNIYSAQLCIGQAGGIGAPGYFRSIDNDPSALSVFNLAPGERLFFRFLTSLGGDPNRAATDIIVWSDTQPGTGCKIGGNPVPDSNCLSGVGPGATFIVCDENESCTSQSQPSLPREVNFFAADQIIPGGFSTGGGYFQLTNNPALSGGNTLSVLGYADNKSVDANPTLNWEVIFPAQREVSQ